MSDADAAAEEDAFVAEYWGRRWDAVRDLPNAEDVPQTEAFRVIQPYVKGLPRGARVLDGGCGTGSWTVYFGKLGFDTVGLDISERTIARLNELLPGREFAWGDVRKTGFPDASFDAYFSWGTFEHFEVGLGPCIEEARRILKPSGLLMISVPFQNWRQIVRQQLPLARWDPNFVSGRGYDRPQRFYQWRLTRAELRRELELRGFRVASVTPLDKREGVNRLLQWDLRLFRPGTRAYGAAGRLLTPLMRASAVSHMVLAVARRGVDPAQPAAR